MSIKKNAAAIRNMNITMSTKHALADMTMRIITGTRNAAADMIMRIIMRMRRVLADMSITTMAMAATAGMTMAICRLMSADR